LEVVAMPLMFHFLHTQRGEEIPSKGGKFKVQIGKQKGRQACGKVGESRQSTFKMAMVKACESKGKYASDDDKSRWEQEDGGGGSR